MTALRLATASVISLLLATSAFSGPDRPVQRLTDPSVLALITNDDSFSTANLTLLLAPTIPGANAAQHYGPYSSTSPDSGTCGNDWATDTFDRHFTVKTNSDGSHVVVEQFKDGSFITNEGFSPGSCDITDGSPPGTVNAAITGGMHGYFIISGVGMQTSSSPYCDAIGGTNVGCTTTTFIDTHFAPCYLAGAGTCPVTTFFFHFSAGDQQLVEHEWKNASADRGGNHGDIRSTNIP
jgi:hypothetical protein